MDLETPSEARVIVNGEPVQGVDPLFLGTLEEARAFVAELDPDQRREVSIFTEDAIYAGSDIGPADRR